jgi:hypothetical protein
MIERPNLSGFASGSTNVLLPSGRSIALADVVYDPDADVFTYQGYDVTDSLYEYQKQAFPTYYEWAVNWNNQASDDRTRAQGRAPVPLGPTTAGGAFLDGVQRDVLTVTDNLRGFFGVGAENRGKMSGLQKIFIVLAVLAAGWLAWKIITAVKEARA